VSCCEKLQRLKVALEEAVNALDQEIKTEAFTHISYANEKGTRIPCNERLEFLGDAVISLAVALSLFERYPDLSEGDLTRMRANLVSGASLASIAEAAGLGKHLLLGKGEELTGGRARPRTLAGAFEALIGAVFLSKGWEEARQLVEETVLTAKLDKAPIDPKTLLQEIVQRTPGRSLEYRVVDIQGPDHLPTYTVACFVDGKEISRGRGSSKKKAEEKAARNVLEKGSLSEK